MKRSKLKQIKKALHKTRVILVCDKCKKQKPKSTDLREKIECVCKEGNFWIEKVI